MSQPLTGPDLLAKVKELGHVDKHELAEACGYVSITPTGRQRANFNAFYTALLQAKGICLDDASNTTVRGKAPSFSTTVHFNGNLMVGRAYVKQMGYKPGDQFQIKLEQKIIRLIPLNQPDDEYDTGF